MVSVDLPEIFDRMLKEWYDKRLFDFESSLAKGVFLNALKYSNCSKKILSKEESLESPSSTSSSKTT